MDIARLTAEFADRYRIERELGAGGMATVYLAHDLVHDQAVAIKVLRQDLAAVLGSERFLREIQIAAQLDHPGIVGVLDSGELPAQLVIRTARSTTSCRMSMANHCAIG